MTMTSLICFAYSIQKTQIVNAPAWFNEQPWDIDGVPDTEGKPNWKQYRRMLQKLLIATGEVGVELEATRAATDVFVIDGATGPTQN